MAVLDLQAEEVGARNVLKNISSASAAKGQMTWLSRMLRQEKRDCCMINPLPSSA